MIQASLDWLRIQVTPAGLASGTIQAAEGGIEERSFAMPEQIRALSHERIARRLGHLRGGTLAELLRRCRLLLRDSG
jgi:mRNA-degrading endonuclease toxin of MazEF toxin-antitoxin module